MSVVGVLAARALELRAHPPGGPLEDAARRAFVDWLGVTLGGSRGVPASALVAGLAPAGGPSRLIGRPETAPAPVAALVNGTSAHTLELDDIYAPGLFHPGAPVIAAALAAADQFDVSTGSLWRAVTTGYEIGCRVAADLGPAHYARWHTTGTAGAIGAAAAVAEVRQAGARQFAHALSLAATMAGGLQQTFRRDAMGKPLHAGAAAQAGVVAAAAAMGGVTGAADVLEGPAGLAAATGSATSWAHSRAGLARPFAIEAVTVKPYPCCGHAFAAIDAALQLRSAGVRSEDVARLDVQTYTAALTVAGITRPRTAAERRFSIPHLVAAALALGPAALATDGPAGDSAASDGTVGHSAASVRAAGDGTVGHSAASVRAAGDGTANGPEVRRLASCVRLTADPVFDGRFPHRRGARVTAVTRDGARRTAEVPDRPGSPENPLATGQLEQKFLAASAAAAGNSGRDLLTRLTRDGGHGPVRALDLGVMSEWVPRTKTSQAGTPAAADVTEGGIPGEIVTDWA